MFREKRSDTRVSTIEATYGVNFHVRSDALLGNLLVDRGFDSLSQLLNAYHGRAVEPSRQRRLFLSFHAEDKLQVNGFRLMLQNPNLHFDARDESVRSAIKSDVGTYLRQRIGEKIRRATVVVCLIGDGTAWRDWVDWEIRKGVDLSKGVCAIRLKDSRGRAPPVLKELGVQVVPWGDTVAMISAIERAAARRSSRHQLR